DQSPAAVDPVTPAANCTLLLSNTVMAVGLICTVVVAFDALLPPPHPAAMTPAIRATPSHCIHNLMHFPPSTISTYRPGQLRRSEGPAHGEPERACRLEEIDPLRVD